MITGKLFADRIIDIKVLFGKYIIRLVIAYIVWHYIYSILLEGDIRKTWENTYHTYHMWYIPMIIGIYICVPVLQVIATNKGTLRYYFLISVIFLSVIPSLNTYISDFFPGIISERIDWISNKLSALDLSVFAGFAFYFLLGYYLGNYDIKRNQRRLIYILGLIGFAGIIGLDTAKLLTYGVCGNYYATFSPNMILMASSVFIWFRYNISEKMNNRIIVFISKCCFGVYLIHVLIIEELDRFLSLSAASFNVVASVPVVSILVFIISFAISALLNNIPIVKRYLV